MSDFVLEISGTSRKTPRTAGLHGLRRALTREEKLRRPVEIHNRKFPLLTTDRRHIFFRHTAHNTMEIIGNYCSARWLPVSAAVLSCLIDSNLSQVWRLVRMRWNSAVTAFGGIVAILHILGHCCNFQLGHGSPDECFSLPQRSACLGAELQVRIMIKAVALLHRKNKPRGTSERTEPTC